MDHRPTAVFIDTKALVHNFQEVMRLVSPGSPVAPVVKSDAYGHGMIGVSRALLQAGADQFAVSLTEEGVELRENGVTVPILVLGGSYPAQAREIVAAKLTPVVTTPALAKALGKAARSLRLTPKIHVQVETGLGRLGIFPEEMPSFLHLLKGMPFLQLEGICTSFSSVDNRELAEEQLQSFEKIVQEAAKWYGKPILGHIAHTGGLLRGFTRPGWLIRPGIMLYGYTRGLEAPGVDLKPVLTWRTEVFKVQSYPAGYPIGYGATYKTKKESQIALLPVGYSDGLLRSYMGKGKVLIRGKRTPLVGRFSMDWAMAEVGHIPGVKAGDEVILIGEQGKDRISADEMAERAGTIIDEVFVSIAKRVPRIFQEKSRKPQKGDFNG